MANEGVIETCGTCVFYSIKDGRCHRFPLNREKKPEVDWCGEFVKAVPPKKEPEVKK